MVNLTTEMHIPHYSESKDLAIIHNGIIENYAAIKQELINSGHTFKSDTDTEVLIHLIEEIKHKTHVATGRRLYVLFRRSYWRLCYCCFIKE